MESLMSFQVSFRKWCLNRCPLFDCIMHLPFIGVEVGMFSGIWQCVLCVSNLEAGSKAFAVFPAVMSWIDFMISAVHAF